MRNICVLSFRFKLTIVYAFFFLISRVAPELTQPDVPGESDSSNSEPPPTEDFVAGNIHDSKFKKFWINEIKADTFVLNILHEGYKLEFESIPPCYYEKNNKTAREDMPFVRSAVQDMLSAKKSHRKSVHKTALHFTHISSNSSHAERRYQKTFLF